MHAVQLIKYGLAEVQGFVSKESVRFAAEYHHVKQASLTLTTTKPFYTSLQVYSVQPKGQRQACHPSLCHFMSISTACTTCNNRITLAELSSQCSEYVVLLHCCKTSEDVPRLSSDLVLDTPSYTTNYATKKRIHLLHIATDPSSRLMNCHSVQGNLHDRIYKRTCHHNCHKMHSASGILAYLYTYDIIIEA